MTNKITIEQIIDYINNKFKNNNNKEIDISNLLQPKFELLDNGMVSPFTFSDILVGDGYYRKGNMHEIIVKDDNTNKDEILNISFWSSILTCLSPTYEKTQNQDDYIKKFLIITKNHLNNIADYLYINIFVFDIITNTISIQTSQTIRSTSINPYKKNVLLLKYNNKYESIINKITNVFLKNDNCMIKLYKMFDHNIDKIECNINRYSLEELRILAKMSNIMIYNGRKLKTKAELIKELCMTNTI